MTAPAAI